MDNKLAYLYQIIERDKIILMYEDIKYTREKLLGLYFYHDETGPVITLDNTLKYNHRLRRCVLAEEVGHHIVGVKSNIIYANSCYEHEIIRNQDENRALHWATAHFIPDLELYQATARYGLRDCYEIAEFFDVTLAFMMAKLTYMKQCFRHNGLKVKGRDIIKTLSFIDLCGCTLKIPCT